MKTKLWTRNFFLVILATGLGSAGAIAGSFALSFLVFDETGSTLASALIIAVQLIPFVFVPFIAAPLMDRLPRKAFLVCGDIANGVIYLLMGVWLIRFEFSYIAYLAVSILLASLGAVDELAFNSIYPDLIPKGAEQKGYSVSAMLYPILRVVMMPLAAVLLDRIGVPFLLIIQGCCSLGAALTESRIRLDESGCRITERYTFKDWTGDIREAEVYLKQERGLRSIFEYMAITNGLGNSWEPILVAFFRTAPGFTAAMYSLFSAAEFTGRTVGSALQYRITIPKEKKFGTVFSIYMLYEAMDMMLLWIPYPLMLVNRGICGFLGSNSSILRYAAVQRYIPENLRSRINAFDNMLTTAACSLLTLAVGGLGELIDYRLCVTICGAAAAAACCLLIWGRRDSVRMIYESEETDGE